jgi:Raf kinase inhibitor-like YbhB/YbcL family protein
MPRLKLFLASLALATAPSLAAQQPQPEQRAALPFMLTSGAFVDGQAIPLRNTQAAPGVEAGKGVSPPLTWANAPAGTVSFLLYMHDMDVARNKTPDDQVHWLVWNIPPATRWLEDGIPEGAKLKDGSYQISATGPMYRGPGAPATGVPHHYMFELYALDIPLDMPATGDAFAMRDKLLQTIRGHVLGKALLVGLFRRPAT